VAGAEGDVVAPGVGVGVAGVGVADGSGVGVRVGSSVGSGVGVGMGVGVGVAVAVGVGKMCGNVGICGITEGKCGNGGTEDTSGDSGRMLSALASMAMRPEMVSAMAHTVNIIMTTLFFMVPPPQALAICLHSHGISFMPYSFAGSSASGRHTGTYIRFRTRFFYLSHIRLSERFATHVQPSVCNTKTRIFLYPA
jgi:hypothetical protein